MSAESPTDRLNRLMRLAIATVTWVRSSIPASGNYEATSSPIYKSSRGAKLTEHKELKDGPGHTEVKDTNPFSERRRYFHQKIEQDEIEKQRVLIRKTFTPGAWSDQAYLSVAKMATETCVASGFGNCGELAYAAAHRLYGMGVRDIDYVEISSLAIINGKVLPHEVVVLGRSTGSTENGAPLGPPQTWGPSAVICDPWDRVAYPASMFSDFSQGMRDAASGLLTWTLTHRFR